MSFVVFSAITKFRKAKVVAFCLLLKVLTVNLANGFYSFSKTLQGNWFELEEEELSDLVYACYWHSHGKTRASATVMTCWDSDRLDLGRVGIRPAPKYLCTDAAKQAEVIQKCFATSIRGH